MSIFVAVEQGSDNKSKGDLLEGISKKLLEAHDYVVETEVRKTGMELDLLCQNKTNPAKKMYVECKAYADDNKVNSDIIKNLYGTLGIQKYKESWLISTSELSKDAKGLVDSIKDSEDSDKFTFYTPRQFLDALRGAHIICSQDIPIQKIKDLLKDDSSVGDTHLLISSFGNYWATEYLRGGEINGVIFSYITNGEIVTDEVVIENLQKLEFKLKDSDLGVVFRLLDPSDKTIEGRRLRGANLKEEYINKMALESGVIVTTGANQPASIDDLFVYPDIEMVNISKKKNSSSEVSSRKILENSDAWLVFGDNMSGKSTLSYILQRRHAELSQIVIRIGPDDLRNLKQAALDKAVIKAFASQYDVDCIPLATVESHLNDVREEIILIIDDFDKIRTIGTSSRAALVTYMSKTYAKVVIFANSARELELMTSNESQPGFEKFKVCRIMQLGHAKRDELIENWITLHSIERLDKAQMLAKKDDFANRINIAIGTNYLPTYSFYVLTILEMLESGSKARLQGSEYASLYGHLVNHALLTNGVKPFDLGFYNTYLAYLAHKLQENETSSISHAELQSLFSDYLALMNLEKSYIQIHDKLVGSRILRIYEGQYSFNLPYYRYFFLAKYLSDDIESGETKAVIKNMVDNLYEDDNANTIVFLVHHSKNSEIIDVIINNARAQFDAIKPQTLIDSEVESINKLITEDVEFVLKGESATEHRKKRLKRQDDYERKQRVASDGSQKSDILDVYGQITTAFRTIDVLGKITSNYSGELTGARKDLIMKELYTLGFRSLRTFLESIENYTESLRSHIEATIDDKNINSSADKSRAADQVIYTFMHIITYSFIKRVSDGVTSADLIKTLDNALSGEGSPAAKLTSIATRLNFPGGLEKNKAEVIRLYGEFSGNSLVRDLLKLLVLEYLYKFEVKYQEKQSICTQLGISYARVQKKRLNSVSKKT